MYLRTEEILSCIETACLEFFKSSALLKHDVEAYINDTHTQTNNTKIKQLNDASQRAHTIRHECGRSYIDQTASTSSIASNVRHSLTTDMT